MNSKHPERLVRYELTFDGTPQNVGIFQGLDDALGPEDATDILDIFSSLPIPDIKIPQVHPQFWFTELGLIKFSNPISFVIHALEQAGWGVEILEADRSKIHSTILYQDEFQFAVVPAIEQNIQKTEICSLADHLMWISKFLSEKENKNGQ